MPGKQPPCAPVSRELAIVEFNNKGGIDNTKARITSRNFVVPSLLRLLVRLLETDVLLAQEAPSNKSRIAFVQRTDRRLSTAPYKLQSSDRDRSDRQSLEYFEHSYSITTLTKRSG